MDSRSIWLGVVAPAVVIAASSPLRGQETAKADREIQVAQRFGMALAQGDFVGAHRLLTGRALHLYSPEELKRQVAEMISYAPGPIQDVRIMEPPLRVWPGRRPGDIAWVYVALTGESFSEAVIVVLCSTRHGTRIRDIEWGRP